MSSTHHEKFYIVNEFDRPSEKLIAEKREDGKFYYIHPDLKSWPGMSPTDPTPLSAFGVVFTITNGEICGDACRETSATYKDGRPRKWQGSPDFSFIIN
jgi:hypothetical protein